jgi:Fur family transcriptional regulator, iron response regulator
VLISGLLEGVTRFMSHVQPISAPPMPSQIRPLLEKYGLRATRQRLGLAKLLFSKGDRHITADVLAAEAHGERIFASLATVYNVLNLFAEVGLVRSFKVEGGKTIFDTNTTDHCHFYFEDSGAIQDIVAKPGKFADHFEPPEGYEIAKVDVVVRLQRKKDGEAAPSAS